LTVTISKRGAKKEEKKPEIIKSQPIVALPRGISTSTSKL